MKRVMSTGCGLLLVSDSNRSYCLLMKIEWLQMDFVCELFRIVDWKMCGIVNRRL